MTRKCALCKESNYKNVYSFFSAPKDPVMRKCWEDALSMEVTDDTFICSKHFHQEDIITHWVSGQPPHVITIKYKKCRLRPSAVPIIGIEFQNIQNVTTEEEDDTFDLKVNRDPLIPQSNEDSEENRTNPRYELSYSQGKRKCRVKEKEEDHDENIQIFIDCGVNYTETVDASEDIKMEQEESQEETFLIPREDINVLIQDESGDYDGAVRDYILRTEQKRKNMLQSRVQQNEDDCNIKKKLKPDDTESQNVIIEDHVYLANDVLNTTTEEQTIEVWDSSMIDEAKSDGEQIIETIVTENCQTDNMLFEDLLEVCTEANLPKGWIVNVIPKGHETTVVYSFTSTTNSSIPFIEKQIYLKSDMLLHFGTSNIEIDPFEHNLIRDGRDSRVLTLSDIEDVVEEFDQRRICEAINETMFYANKNLSTFATREGSKWRHLECPILLADGITESICIKCDSLLVQSKNSQENKEQHSEDLENNSIDVKDETILEFELNPSPSKNNLVAAIDNLNIPEIQKIMMKECLKTNSELDRQKSIKFSKTWIFLCVLLYIESPRMYRYLLLNNYLSLPPLFTIQRYLHRIKTDQRFYSYFQRSIEPFQPCEKDNGEIKINIS